MPSISVIIPTYNRAAFVADTVNSALRQDFEDFEVLVVNDGSTDNTMEVLGRFGDRIKLLSHSNQGLGASRNLGLRHATGKYAALLDDDDLWFPWTLKTYWRAIEQCDSPWLISSRGVEFSDVRTLPDTVTAPARQRYFEDFYASHGPAYWVTPSGSLFLADAARKAGGFFQFNYGHEENDLWFRQGDQHGFVIIDDPICFARRVHAQNISSFSNRNLLGTRYLLEQESRGSYPGGKERLWERLDLLAAQIRPVSMSCVRQKRLEEGWKLYFKTFRWHLRLGRWRYLLGFPLLSLGQAVRGQVNR